MKKVIACAIGVAALLGLYTTSYAFNYVHEDDFESGSIEAYTVEAKNGASAQIVSEGSSSDNNVLKMTGVDSNISLVQKSFDAVSNIAVFDMDFMRESSEGGSVRVMQIYDSAKKNRPFLLTASKTGLVVRNGEQMSAVNAPEYRIGVRVNLRVVLDFNTKTYDLYVNGKLYCNNNAFFQAGAEDAGIVQIQIDGGTGTGVCKVDNFAVYGINNEEIDKAILETESALASYVVGKAEGEYSETRYIMLKDRLTELRDMTREVLTGDDNTMALEKLEEARNEFEKGKIYPESESGEIEAVANEITAEFDGTTIFTSGDGITEYVLNAVVTDNFGRGYSVEPTWECIDAPNGVVLDVDTLEIPMGTQGKLKLRARVDNIYRDFILYLRNYSRVTIEEITAANGLITVKGDLVRNSDDDVKINITLGDVIYGSTVVENNGGKFECIFEVSDEVLTTDGMLTVSGEYVNGLNKSFVYFASDAADVALIRIENGTDEEISETITVFSDYLNVHTDTFANDKETYIGLIKNGIPYSSADALNKHLSEINFIIEISNAVRGNIETIITDGLDIIKDCGFDIELYNNLSTKAKNSFFTGAVGVHGTELDYICFELNKIMEKCNKTTPVRLNGGGGGGSGGRTTVPNINNGYTVTPVTKNEQPPEKNSQNAETTDTYYDEFTDENDAEWAKEAIHKLRSMGVIEGYENRIRPNDPITRGEIVKMVAEAFDIARDAEVTGGDTWWREYAERCVISGIIEGYEDGDFHGDDLLIRQDMAVIISRIVDYKEIPVYAKEVEKVFNDGSEISDYALRAVCDLQRYGILSGIGDNMFAPHSYVTRAQAIMAIYNVLMAEQK